MLTNRFALEKLKIYIYEDRKRLGIPKDTFEFMFNPESYSLKHGNELQKSQAPGSSGHSLKYSLSKPAHLSLTLYLDGTGAAAVGRKDVYKEVDRFLKLTTYMNGKIHQPNFLKIEWGDLIYNCRLTSVDISYSLFNRSGQPLRAKLTTEFSSDIENSRRIKKEKKIDSDSDSTQMRTIQDGDNLPAIAQEIYDDPAYYLEIARANNIDNFRKINIGNTLYLPPIKS